ncbi:Uncharacterised protein [Mycobacteroides abscessus subsp. abscessus]|nr:Uncharacterised protein [Mycobacteroides abscessus subsp. abscessus]
MRQIEVLGEHRRQHAGVAVGGDVAGDDEVVAASAHGCGEDFGGEAEVGAEEFFIRDVHGVAGSHRQALADRRRGTRGRHRDDGDLGAVVAVGIGQGDFECAFADLVEHGLRGGTIRQTGLEIELAIPVRVRDLFDQHSDLQRGSLSMTQVRRRAVRPAASRLRP